MRSPSFVFVCLFVIVGCARAAAPEFRDGDIIFQISRSDQSRAIQIATSSVYTHMGVIYAVGEDYFVYEAVQPVKLTPLPVWIGRGEKSHYVVKRLKNAPEIMTGQTLEQMRKIGETFRGRDYDLFFSWTDNQLYCSELVWKIYKRAAGIEIGKLQRLKEFKLNHPIVRSKLKERYGDHIPYDEVVISPASIFSSDQLTTVYESVR